MKIKSFVVSTVGLAIMAAVGMGAAFHRTGGHNPVVDSCPLMQDHNHTDGVNKRGDQAMGFDHLKTTHHFLLNREGGVIQVEVNDPRDETSRDQIRMHLQHISHMFSMGNFDIPMLVHDREVPGTKAMTQLKESISYSYRETKNGAQVVIVTKNAEGLKAVYEFLRFQIQDHQTGDPTEVK